MIIDCEKWPAGIYKLKAFATNRTPENSYSGTYIYDSKQAELVVSRNAKNNIRKSTVSILNVKNTIIWSNDSIYACFPSLDKLNDGSIVTNFATRKYASHTNTEGGTLAMISKDNGKTWEKANTQQLIRKFTDRDKELISVDIRQDKQIFSKEDTLKIEKSASLFNLIINLNILKDNGPNWEKQKINVPSDVKGLTVFEKIKLKNGNWLISMYGPRINIGKNINSLNEVYFLKSTDGAENWQFIYQTPNGVKKSEQFNETALLQLPNSIILAMQRASDKDGLFSSFSKDNGNTWSYPERTSIWGYPADMVVLSDGRILCVYSYRKAPLSIRACISKNNGKTWDIKNEMVIRNDIDVKNIGDFGYPKIVKLANEELLVVYYLSTDEKTPHIASSRFKLPN